MQFSFGSGSLWGVNNATNSTPVEFGALQDVTLDFSFNLKELRGQYQFPLAVARGGGKITGKAKFGNISSNIFNNLFFGQTSVLGQILVAKDEQVNASSSGVAVANGATFRADLGVQYNGIGVALTRVASAPAAGQYTVDGTGTYTFSAADSSPSIPMKIDYSYSATSTTSFKTTLTNQLMGSSPTFKVTLWEKYDGKILTIELKACVSNKLAMVTKLEDFTIPELDFEAMADSSGNIGIISITEP